MAATGEIPPLALWLLAMAGLEGLASPRPRQAMFAAKLRGLVGRRQRLGARPYLILPKLERAGSGGLFSGLAQRRYLGVGVQANTELAGLLLAAMGLAAMGLGAVLAGREDVSRPALRTGLAAPERLASLLSRSIDS